MPDTSVRKILKGVRNLSGPLFWSTRSYSQEGEDLVLKRLFDATDTGFYVEVGCHHPFRFSNTYLFYKRGWRGICIDPLPGTARAFRRWRPRDITLEVGVSAQPATLTYYMFDEPAVNTFDGAAAQRVGGTYNLVEKRSIPTEPLASILEKNLPVSASRIDFFSIDVEGLDLEVLRSNDWARFAPRAVIAECLFSDLASLQENEVVRFLAGVGYTPYAKTGQSIVFVLKEQNLAVRNER
jgi:FkbM family methyltransferase